MKSQERFEASLRLFDRFSDSVVMLGPDHRIEWANSAFLAKLGDNPTDKTLSEVWPYVPTDAIQTLLEDQESRIEVQSRSLDRKFELSLLKDATKPLVVIREVGGTLRLPDEINTYKDVVDGLPLIAWVAGTDGTPIFFSREWYAYTGAADIESYDPQNYIHPEDLESTLQKRDQAYKDGNMYETEVRIRRHDGHYRWHKTRAQRIGGPNNETIGFIGSSTDIHQEVLAKTKIQTKERRLQELIEAATIGVIVNDVEGNFLYTNTPLLKLLGYERGDVESKNLNWGMIQIPENQETDDIALDQLRASGNCLPYETELVRKDGSRVSVYVGGSLITGEDGLPSLGAAFITDLTDLKAAEHELKTLNEELDSRVRVRTSELEESNRALEAYSYHVAHDLRAPLRAIASTSRILEEDFREQMAPEMLSLLERQSRAAIRLSHLVDDLLKISRVSAIKLQPRELNVTILVRRLSEEILDGHKESQVQFEVEEDLKTFADETLAELVFLNLLDNAVKYSPAGGTIRVSLEESGEFSVADQGIGFDMTYVAKIFEPFERLHRDDTFSGNGVGLANVRHAIKRHDGHVRVESEVGKGSKFYFAFTRLTNQPDGYLA